MCILTSFIQLYSVITHAHWAFIKNMTKSLLKAMFLFKGDDKAIVILQNVIKVMVVIKLDVMMGKHGHNVLRLPAYDANLNPIEMIWAQAIA